MNDTTSLAQKIQNAVDSAAPPDISIDELLQQPSDPGPVHVATIDVASLLAKLGSVYRIAALVPGLPIGQWLPNQAFISPIFNSGVVNLTTVTYWVAVEQRKVVRVWLAMTLGEGGAGLGLQGDIVAATATNLDLYFYPDYPGSTAITVGGTVLINQKLSLDAALSAPSLDFSCAIPKDQTVPFANLTGAFGLDCPSSLQLLSLQAFALQFGMRDGSASLTTNLVTQSGKPLPIMDGLALDELSLELGRAPGAVELTIAAVMTVRDKIVVDAQVSGGTGRKWAISGSLDVAATAANFAPQPVTFANIVSAMIGVSLPSALDFLGGIAIDALAASATLSDPMTWELDLEIGVDWTLGSAAFKADTKLKIKKDGSDDKQPPTGTVTADMRIGEDDGPGLALTVTYSCTGKDNNSLDINAPQLEADFSYNLSDSQMVTTFAGRSLGELIGQVAGIFTGNPYVTLPSPWSDVLNAIPLPSLTVTVYFKDSSDGKIKAKTVQIEHDLSPTIDFFGNKVKGFVLTYDPSKDSGQRVSFEVKGDFPVLDGQPTTWDPTKPGRAPTVPGQGAKVIDIQLVAAGQRIEVDGLANAATVEDAVKAIADAAKAAGGSDPDKFPKPDAQRGWLVGTHMVIKGALDFQFVFADPLIYGAVIQVTSQKDTPKALAALDGLYAEILYRKVTSSIGVYEGMLTLPDKIRLIDYGAFKLQLPSIAVDVYTNGDFMIDVGFPHNGDFSHSAVINAGQYVGAGGVYYGHLSGATASALPAVYMDGDRPIGVFNTVTEIGIGLRVGFGRSYSEGPLSASISVVIQAIFEGVFANYSQLPPNAHPTLPTDTDYYRIVASLGIVGQLEGSIDFVIVTASLLVEISVVATITAEAYKAVEVDASVSVDVEITVKINCGLFSIHIHCSFSTTVSLQARFGSDATEVPWGPPPGRLAARARLLTTAAPLTLAFEKPPCANVATALYVVPQLSRGLANVQLPTPSGTPEWAYMLQLALRIDPPDQSLPQGTFADFAKFVTAWVVDAAWKHSGTPGSADDFYKSLQIDLTKAYDKALDRMMSPVDYLIDALKAIAHDPPSGFDANLKDFFAQNRFTLVAATTKDDGASFGFFPLVPELALTGSGGQVPAGLADVADRILRAYAIMVATSVLNALNKLQVTSPITLKDAYASSGFSVTGAVGMATRFMLHGSRYASSGNLMALYRAAGQAMTQIDVHADKLSITISGPSSADGGVTVPGGQLTLSSTDQQQRAVHTPAEIAGYVPGVKSAGVSASLMPCAVQVPLQFSVKQGPPNAAPSLRALPDALQPLAGASTTFDLYWRPRPDSAWVEVAAGAWSWCSTIDFRVQRVPDSATPGKFLADVYALVSVRSDGLDRLEDIYQASGGTPNFKTLEIVYGIDANQASGGGSPTTPTFVTVDPGASPPKVFLFQSNISTETNPPHLALLMASRLAAPGAPAIDPKLVFLGRLLTGGLTNSGGYYLYLDLGGSSLPDAMFDARGMAWLTLAVSDFTGAGGKMASYFSAVRLASADYAGPTDLALRSEDMTVAQATIASGVVGVQIQRPDWSQDDDSKYQRSLDGLFNLIDCEPASFVPAKGGPNWTVAVGVAGHVVGPIRLDSQTDTDTTHYYRAQFDLLAATGQQPDVYPSPPKDAANPYQFIGAALALGYSWIDFYGNTLPADFKADNLAIGLVDPMLGLDDWPGLSYGFSIEGGADAPVLTVSMTFIPQVKGQPVDAIAYGQYVKIYHQLKSATVTAQAACVKSALAIPSNQTAAADVLRQNILTILQATDKTPSSGPGALGALSFPLPTPVSATSYNDSLLYQLTASLVFTRPGPVASGLGDNDGTNPILVKRTALAPFQQQAAQAALNAPTNSTLLGYGPFATNLETTLAPLGFRVMAGDLDVPGGAQFWLLRWQGQGLQVSFVDGGTGFAPTPIATSLQSRKAVDQDLFSHYKIPYLSKHSWPIAVVNMDMDAALSDALTAIESFLSPEYAIPAAIALPAEVDGCIAYKQALAEALAARVVPLSDSGSDASAATMKYQQACLLDLRNYYAVDAAASLTLKVDAPQLPPNLIVYGHFDLPQGANVSLSAGQSQIDPPQGTTLPLTVPMALSLSARHKDWQAEFAMPQTFYVEALERVAGEIDVIDPDEPSGKTRKYVTGTWLRFITDQDRDLTLGSPPTIPLPLRSYPPMPTLSAQGFSELDGKDLESVKSWSLDCTYLHQFAAQDTVHITAVLNQAPTPQMLLATSRPDLLDALTLFQALYPSIRATFDSSLRLPAGAQQPLPQDTLDAITSFVAIAQCISEHFHYQPDAANIASAPPGNAFTLTEGFATKDNPNPDPATTPWWATLARIPGSDGVLRTDAPIPGVVIDMTPAGQAPSDATVFTSTPVQGEPSTYHFLNSSQTPQTLMAKDAIGNQNRSLQIRPLDIVDWHNGRYYLQIFRNEGMPQAFQYVTGIVAAKDRVLPFITHSDEIIDLMQADLPRITYGPGGPTPNSFGDLLARLYYKLLGGDSQNPQRPPGGMRVEVALTYPLIAGAPADPQLRLPNVRVPIALQLVPDAAFTFYPSPDQAWTMAKDLAGNVTTWLASNVGTTVRPDLYKNAGLDIAITVFSATSEISLPMIYIDGLYVACSALAG